MNAVIGKYLSGQYICIPDLDTGCPLSRLTDTFWNSERLSGRIPEVDAITIAYALEAVSEYLGGGLDLTARDIQLCAKKLLGEVCGLKGQFNKRKGRPSGGNRAACLRIVYGLGAISDKDTKCSIQRCQIITGRRMEKAVWKAAVNREVNNCVYNWTSDRITGRFATANEVKSVTSHEVINSTTP